MKTVVGFVKNEVINFNNLLSVVHSVMGCSDFTTEGENAGVSPTLFQMVELMANRMLEI